MMKQGEAPGVGARRAAAQLLHAVTAMGSPLEGALPRATRGLAEADRALARALASQALRWLPDIDQRIDSMCQRPLPPDARARMVLRVALAGHYLLGTPAHAVVATALPLVEGGPRRLVHGVLSNLLKRNEPLTGPSLPPAVDTRWRAAWGDAVADAAAASLATQPPVDLRLKQPADTAAWMERLGATSLFPGHLRLPAGAPLTTLAGFAAGEWWVQDAAAQWPALLLGDVQGARVLDLCAAPGGKTMQLAAAGAQLVALDRSEARMRRLRENLARTSLSAELVVGDALQWQPDAPFDAILLDAPCSATGTFRRHPDVLWRNAGRASQDLRATQAALLQRAAEWLQPGGRLVYAVCSLEPEEGEQLPVPAGLQREAAPDLPPGLAADAEGAIRTLPGLWAAEGGADGFYMARFRR